MIYRTATLLLLLLAISATAQPRLQDEIIFPLSTLQLRPCDDPALQCSQNISDAYAQGLQPIGNYALGKRTASHAPRLQRAANSPLFEIGLMANTYCMIGENRNQIACDPFTGEVAVVFRGNDRSQDGDGNSLYIRYSTDHGTSWSQQGDNVATTAKPRYPSIFLPNSGSGSHMALLWPQVVSFGDGSEDFGQVNAMRADLGNDNPTYSALATPPNWSIPWSIIMDQETGYLYSASEAVEPSNGFFTGEYFLLRSTDGGAQWAPVDIGEPVYGPNLVPSGFVALNHRLDISPDGSTMILSWIMVIESEPGRANLLDDDHEIAWRISTDDGASWSETRRLRIADISEKPAPFSARIAQSWDLDVALDYRNRIHFLTVCSADLNPFDPFDEANPDSTINLRHVDSTFVTEITQNDDGTWSIVPIGPVRRVRVDRLSFTAASDDDAAAVFRNEPKWARSRDGKKLWAKWITPFYSWTVSNVAGVPTLFADTITQIYANGRHVDSRHDIAWMRHWDFAQPEHNSFAMDSLMRLTALTDVGAKYSKMASLAGDDGQLHILFVEWGVGETVDDDPINSDQVVWYLQDVQIPVTLLGVEQVDSRPADFTLRQNYPNPFNPETVISFSLPQRMTVRLAVYDMLGREVALLADGMHEAGTHRARFDGARLASGMYVCRLDNGLRSTSVKMMLTR
ncbi:MAG: T9SS type A sorting domain-containing protein [Bacteroidota bacterium]|nr:T9SS type A sorting domain-containing protein [Bacteroidota bacterium]